MHMHAPSWIIASSKSTADIGYQALGPAIGFTAFALIIVILRWYTRVFLTRRVRLEDVLITVAMVLSMAMTGVMGGEVELDTGNQNDEVKANLLSTMMILVFAQSIFFYTCINLVKISIVIQYIWVFSSVPGIRRVCYVLLLLIAGAGTWGILGVIFLCKPVQKYWHVEIPGTCIDPEDSFWSSSIIGIVLDFSIWILPMPVIGGLQLPGRQKTGLLVVFGLGGFVCIVGILRLILVHAATEDGKVTRSGTYALIWSTIEVNVAIICASLLVMKPLIVHFFPNLMIAPASSRDQMRVFRAASGGWAGSMNMTCDTDNYIYGSQSGLGKVKTRADNEGSSNAPVSISIPGACHVPEDPAKRLGRS